MPILHNYVSAKPPAVDASEVGSVEWNEAHDVTSLLFTPQPLVDPVQEGLMEFKGHTLYMTTFQVRRSVALVQEIPVADVTVGETVTETTIYSIPMEANYLTAGKHIESNLQGIFSSIAGPLGALTLRVKYAGATVAAFTTAQALNTAAPFDITVNTTCRAIGDTTGKLISWAEFSEGFTTIVGSRVAGPLTDIDTTVANTIIITAQWASSNAGNTITVQHGHTLCLDANT